jgi:nitric oxide reductase subunit B
MQQDLLQTLRWVRTFGDVVFIIGALAVSWQVVLGVFQRRPSAAPKVVNPAAHTEAICCGSCGGSNKKAGSADTSAV